MSWKKSIQVQISLMLVIVITSVLSLYSLYQYAHLKSITTEELFALADTKAERLTKQLLMI